MSYCIDKTESHGFCMPINTTKERERFLDFAKHLMVEYIAFLDKKEEMSANYRDHSAQDVRDAYGELWGNVRDWDDTLSCLRKFLTDTWDCPFKLDVIGEGDYVWFEFDFDSGAKWHGDDEMVFIKAFAPFAEEGAFIGFEGEDSALWSYVYDGQGGYQECFPEIDWRHGYKKPQDDPAPDDPKAALTRHTGLTVKATVTFRRWEGDVARFNGEAEFDACDALDSMDDDDIAAVGRGEPYAWDQVYRRAVKFGQIHDYDGPFEVDLDEDNLADYFEAREGAK